MFDEEYTLPDAYFVAGQVCTAVVRSMSSGAKAGPADFVPFFRPPPGSKLTPAEMMAKVRGGFASARAATATQGP